MRMVYGQADVYVGGVPRGGRMEALQQTVVQARLQLWERPEELTGEEYVVILPFGLKKWRVKVLREIAR